MLQNCYNKIVKRWKCHVPASGKLRKWYGTLLSLQHPLSAISFHLLFKIIKCDFQNFRNDGHTTTVDSLHNYLQMFTRRIWWKCILQSGYFILILRDHSTWNCNFSMGATKLQQLWKNLTCWSCFIENVIYIFSLKKIRFTVNKCQIVTFDSWLLHFFMKYYCAGAIVFSHCNCSRGTLSSASRKDGRLFHG